MRISELAERYGAKPTQARYDALIEGIKASDKSIVSVVRCKDCKHCIRSDSPNGWCEGNTIFVPDDWFCADGERRE